MNWQLRSLLIGFCLLFVLPGATATAAHADFAIPSFGASLAGPGGTPDREAGSHPDLTTTFAFAVRENSEGGTEVDGNLKDLDVQLPPGLIGNPGATPRCNRAELAGAGSTETFFADCSPDTQVGISTVGLVFGGPPTDVMQGVYNMEPPRGVAAEFGLNVGSVPIFIDARLAGDGGYKLEARIVNVSQALAIATTELTLWGVPADPSHDAQRYDTSTYPPEPGIRSNARRLPFVSNPTTCAAPLVFHAEADSWQQPGVFHQAEAGTGPGGEALPVEGCDRVPFEGSVTAQPTTTAADSPSGLDVTVSTPQSTNPVGLATSNLREARVELPAGMTVDPSSANGLGSCSAAQIGLGEEAPDSCPASSKIGTVEIDTPLLEAPLPGSVYLARQGENKFGSLLALYLAFDDPVTGTVLKLPGKIEAGGTDGRLTATFAENPQLPFETLHVKLFGGPGAPLRTPPRCGTYETNATLTPWSGATSVDSRSSFAITGGPDGGPCPNGSFAPSFSAGTTDPLAGHYAPLVVRLTRPDASPELGALSVTLPRGLLAKLAGLRYCPDTAIAGIPGGEGTAAAQLVTPGCPPASRVGSVSVAAGAGSSPFHLETGSAYLAGPYKGAPLSLAVVVPAAAGPFDLGNVVVRAALEVDPETAQVTAVSDPLPRTLDGIPLDLRELRVEANRPGFTRNPTNCAPQAFEATAGSVTGAVAKLQSRFRVAGCGELGFAPKLGLRLIGATKRGKDPALRATLKARPEDAGIGRATVVLPHTEFIDQSHIGNVCTRPQFAAGTCPANSVLGSATAATPLLDQPLQGLVYLRSNGGERKLPDLVVALKGQIDVTLVGYIDSVKRKGSEGTRIRTTFAQVPDAPISRFTLRLAGGKKGLLQNSADICAAKQRPNVRLIGQNGAVATSRAPISIACGGRP